MWWQESSDDLNPEVNNIRDYYRVEDLEGQHFWVFQDGLLNLKNEVKWYLHGFFP